MMILTWFDLMLGHFHWFNDERQLTVQDSLRSSFRENRLKNERRPVYKRQYFITKRKYDGLVDGYI